MHIDSKNGSHSDILKPWKNLRDLGPSAINLLPHVVFMLICQAKEDAQIDTLRNKDLYVAHLIFLQFAKLFNWNKGLKQIEDCSYMDLGLLDRGPMLARQR